MRNKIDNLILVNLIWFVLASCGTILQNPLIVLAAIAGAFFNVFYDIFLVQKIRKMIDDKYQPHLFKRVFNSGLFSVIFILFTLLNLFF